MKETQKKMQTWPAVFLLLAVFGCAAYFIVKLLAPGMEWIAVASAAGLLVLWCLLWFLLMRRNLNRDVVVQGLMHNNELSGSLARLKDPYLLLDKDGQILWFNDAFAALLAEQAPSADPNGSVYDLFAYLPEDGYVQLGDRMLHAYRTPVSEEMGTEALSLYDETDFLETSERLQDEQNVIGIVYVDNFEDLIKNTDDANQGLLEALIGQRIHRYFQGYGGVVMKTERDRFMVAIDAKGLRGCREDRFSLLEQVKEIHEGNSGLVTVSMAFGEGSTVYDENLTAAHSAMDLALGRGGDQAIIKNGDEIEYFGGKVQGDSSDTRVKARLKAQALRELIAPRDRVFIMGHRMADNDSFGAAVAIYRAAVSLRKPAHIVLNSVSFSVRPFWERFQTSAEYPREMFITGETAEKYIDANDLVVVVDTNRNSMTECPALLEATEHVVVFDHHRQMAEAIPSTLSYVEPYASSACEMTAEILQYFGDDLRPRPIEAEAIYSGIVVDTNGFTDRTGARTFEAAAYLKRSGANLVLVKKLLRENIREYKAKAETIRNAEMFMEHFAFAECLADGLDSPTIVGAQAANELLGIAGVKASFVFTKVEDTVFVSLRSIDEVNVQRIAERLGGGGHLSVAGVQFKNISVEDAMRQLCETLQTMAEEGVL